MPEGPKFEAEGREPGGVLGERKRGSLLGEGHGALSDQLGGSEERCNL